MIIVDLRNQQTVETEKTMAKRRNVRDSFGKRVRDEREELELTQADMIRILRERYGIETRYFVGQKSPHLYHCPFVHNSKHF